ncbi:MAG: hypothetical protein KAS23_12670 [Anaerohalosphaera sp.]|nr:hypothetical protein [Anaerohalosphaera sp.]
MMKSKIITVALMLFVCDVAQPQEQSDISCFQSQALNIKSEFLELPPVVLESLCQYTLNKYISTPYEELYPFRFADCFVAISCSQMPHDGNLSLYSYTYQTEVTNSHTLLIVYDTQTKRMSSKILSFLDQDLHLTRGHRFSFDDLNLDGQPELVTQDALHSGTNVNHACSTYWHMDENLSFVPIFRFKTYQSAYILGYKRVDEVKVRYCTVASVKAFESNTIVVTTSLALENEDRTTEQVIGKVVLKSKELYSPFEPVEESVSLEKYARYIKRQIPFEYEYQCLNQDCSNNIKTQEYSGTQVKCPKCGQLINYTGEVVITPLYWIIR